MNAESRAVSHYELAAVIASWSHAIVGRSLDGTIRNWNHAAERLFGPSAHDAIGRHFSEVLPPQGYDLSPEIRQRLESGESLDVYEVEQSAVDGRRLTVQVSRFAVRSPSGTLLGETIVAEDITERRAVEHRRAVRATVTGVLAGAEDAEETVRCVLETICREMGFDVAAYWVVDPPVNRIRCSVFWQHPGIDAPQFSQRTRDLSLAPNSSLPGRVWASREPVWITDVVHDATFVRSDVAASDNLHTACACPVRIGGEVLGVVEFFSREIRQLETHVLNLICSLAANVGQFIERKRAESELRESESRFRLLSEILPQLIWTASPDGMVEFVNLRWQEYTGLSDEQARGTGWMSVAHPQELSNVADRWRSAVETGSDYEMELRLRRHDGSFQWFLARGRPLHDAQGQIVRWFGTCTGIDELKQTQQTLLSQSANLHEQAELLELAHDAIIIRSMTGEILYWNRGAEAIYQWPKEEVQGQKVQELLRTEYSKPLPQIESHLLRHGRWEGTLLHHSRDGKRLVISSRWALKRDESGNAFRVLETNTDITDRRRAEDSLQFIADASEIFASLIDAQTTLRKVSQLAVPFLSDACIVFREDEHGNIRSVAATHIDPVKGMLLQQIQQRYPVQRPLSPMLRRVLRDGQMELVEAVNEQMLRDAAADDEHLQILRRLNPRSYMAVPLLVHGRVLGALAFFISESERRYSPVDLSLAEELAQRAAVAIENARLYAEVRDADRRKDEFLATLAHELRNPLAPIRNAVELMRMRGLPDAELESAREAIDRQAQQLTRLVDDLLDVSRITLGKVELRTENVRLQSIVTRAVEATRPLIEQLGHRLEVSLPPKDVILAADPARLEQVLDNLLNNAAKYTEPGGRISLATTIEESDVAIRVRDTGIGMSQDFLPRLFNIFVQADHHHGRAQGGLGIGLSLCRRLVEMHGGQITARSDGPGRGSEFTIRLPYIAQAATESKPHIRRNDQEHKPAARQILVVDDNIDAAKTLAMLLRLLGHQVHVVHDGAAALEAIQQQPDLVFLDIGLPKMDGYEVAQRVRELPHLNRVILVALTGWGQEEDRRRSREAGFNEHLTKPVDFATLQRILRDLSEANRSGSRVAPADARAT